MGKVAHILNKYLFLTGSWIYGQIKNLKKYKALVFCIDVENLSLFPYRAIFCPTLLGWKKGALFILKKILVCINYAERVFSMPFFIEMEDIIQSAWEEMLKNEFFNIAKREGVSLLHAHFGDQGKRALPLKKALSIPMIVSFYGYDVSRLPRRSYWRKHYKRLFDEAELFLAEGGFMAQCLKNLGCKERKIIVHHLGIDLEDWIYKERVEEESIKILQTARFVEKKGIIHAIKAFSKVCIKHKRATFYIIGDGPQRNLIEKTIKECNLADKVILLGSLPYHLYREWMYKAHIFLHPSCTASDGDTEGGAPVCLIEAQACGMPVLSTYHADIPEVVIDNESGFLAKERDVNDLAEKLDYLLSMPSLWKKMGEKGREHVQKNYNIKVQAEKLEEIYEKI